MVKNKKIVTIELDKERHLYFNLNSLEIIESLTGKSITDIGENMDFKTLKILVYAGLRWEDKKLTVDAVGDMIGFEDIQPVSEAIGEAFKGLK